MAQSRACRRSDAGITQLHKPTRLGDSSCNTSIWQLMHVQDDSACLLVQILAAKGTSKPNVSAKGRHLTSSRPKARHQPPDLRSTARMPSMTSAHRTKQSPWRLIAQAQVAHSCVLSSRHHLGMTANSAYPTDLVTAKAGLLLLQLKHNGIVKSKLLIQANDVNLDFGQCC